MKYSERKNSLFLKTNRKRLKQRRSRQKYLVVTKSSRRKLL
jgi:hypothetical protein